MKQTDQKYDDDYDIVVKVSKKTISKKVKINSITKYKP